MLRTIFLSFLIIIIMFQTSCKSTDSIPPSSEKSTPAVIDNTLETTEEETEPPAAAENTAEDTFTLDEETYVKTKQDISLFIETLNRLIENRDYETWLNYLSQDYFDYYSDPDVLKEQSASPLLKKYKIVLRSLKDYFNFVVVGSRKNVRLDEIKPIDPDHIKAYMYINDTPVIIYELVKIDGQWKIAHF